MRDKDPGRSKTAVRFAHCPSKSNLGRSKTTNSRESGRSRSSAQSRRDVVTSSSRYFPHLSRLNIAIDQILMEELFYKCSTSSLNYESSNRRTFKVTESSFSVKPEWVSHYSEKSRSRGRSRVKEEI